MSFFSKRRALSLTSMMILSTQALAGNFEATQDNLINFPPYNPNESISAFVNTETMWKVRQIPVCWTDLSQSTPADRAKVVQAASRWTAEAANYTQFTGWGQCPSNASTPGIRIYVSNSISPMSYIGTAVPNTGATMFLNFFTNANQVPPAFSSCAIQSVRDKCIIALAAHEFGHALGFQHEQNSPLTPRYCRDQVGHAPHTWLGNLTLANQWDATSVMNYCHNIYANNGALSRMDKLATATWYGNIPYIQDWDSILYVPVLVVNGVAHSLKIKNNGGVFSIIEFKPTNQISAKNATMNGYKVHIPVLKFLPNQNDRYYVSELYDVEMQYHPHNNTLTITKLGVAR